MQQRLCQRAGAGQANCQAFVFWQSICTTLPLPIAGHGAPAFFILTGVSGAIKNQNVKHIAEQGVAGI